MANVFSALMGIAEHAFVVPAQNKWTTMYSCVQSICFLMNFHNILCAAEMRVHRRQPPEERAEADAAAEESQDPIAQFTSERRRWAKRVADFLHQKNTQAILCIFLAVARPCMVLHWILFKHCTSRPAPSTGERVRDSLVFDVCAEGRSPVMKAIQALSAMTCCESAAGLLQI